MSLPDASKSEHLARSAYQVVRRFEEQVDRRPDGCWEWGSLKTHGYREVSVRGVSMMAHRVVWELTNGPIPEGLLLDHLCRNRGCVNPKHLESVSCQENLLRGEGFNAINAAKTHCKQGHPFDGANLRIGPSGRRHCRMCARAATARHRTRKRVVA